MASLVRDSNGTKRVQFTAGDGRRRTIRLGKLAVKPAETFRVRVESLISAAITGTPADRETLRWAADLPDVMHAKLARVNLIECCETQEAAAPGEPGEGGLVQGSESGRRWC